MTHNLCASSYRLPTMTHNLAGDTMAQAKIDRIVYKGAFLEDGKKRCVIALGIPEDAEVVSEDCINGKERASKAITLGIASMSYMDDVDVEKQTIVVHPLWHRHAVALFYRTNGYYEYNVGHLQTPWDMFDPNPHVTCASGIHFFQEVEMAVKYGMTNGKRFIKNNKAKVKGTERVVKFAFEQAERHDNGQRLLLWPSTDH
jgi:hypothetical protein